MLPEIVCAAFGMAMISAQLQAAQSNADEKKQILALRAEHNRAIAAHDLDGAMRVAADDFVSIGGSSGIERSRAETRKRWAEQFATEGHDRYVRTPTQIEVGERKGVLRAAELGRWEGIDRKAAGMSRPFGRYFAHWSKVTGHWRIVSETYVTLGCRGPGC
jgi:ketosteroid isomerase-like protein